MWHSAAVAVKRASLGRLTNVQPRLVWTHEAHDFTPWLLDNVDVLSDLLGMDLILEEAEHPVGGFKLDLKGSDESTGEVVIVENQLEISDHSHLGQIITYAAGTDPTTIVWITTGFRAEHRAAIDWLNQRTDENTRVFGVVIQVVRIGDSEPAPNFELVAQPNDWNKHVKKVTSLSTGESGRKAEIYREFWDQALSVIRTERPRWTRRNTSKQPFCDTRFGSKGILGSMVWTRDNLSSQIYFQADDPELAIARWKRLHSKRVEFEAALREPAVWDPMEGHKAARVYLTSSFDDIFDRERWPEMTAWLIETQTRLREAWDAVGGADDAMVSLDA